jgi:WD40 repeat protein
MEKPMSGRLSVVLVALLPVVVEAPPLLAQESKSLVDRFGDPLPPQALARFGTVRFRQAWMQGDVLYHPDGKALATCGVEDGVVLWDVESGRRLRQIGRHTSTIQCAAFSRDGKLLASADYEQNVLVSDFATGHALQSFKAPNLPTRLAFSPDGKYLACGGLGGDFQVWNLETAKVAHQGVETRGHHIYGLEFAHDSKVLAVGGTSDRILLVSTDDWKTTKTLAGGGYRLRFAPDGRHIVSIGDKGLTWWDIDAGKPIHQLKLDDPPYNVALHPNGKLAATASASGYFKIWDLEAGKLLKQCATPQLYVFGLAFSPDGRKLATSDASLELWDTTTWKRLSRFDGPTAPANLIAFADNGAKIVSLHNHQPHFQVRQWDVATTKEIGCVERHDGGLYRHVFSGDGRWLAGCQWNFDPKRASETNISVWDTRTGEQRYALWVPNFIHECTVSRENHHLTTMAGHNQFVFWDLDFGKQLRTYVRTEDPVPVHDGKQAQPMPPRSVYALALSPRAEWLAGAEGDPNDNAISVWNAASGVREQRFGQRKNGGRLLDFFPIGRALADGVSTERGAKGEPPQTSQIEVWEPYSGKSRRRLPAVPEFLHAMAVSPNGRLIASGYASGAVRVWDVASGQQLGLFAGHQGGINSLAFAPDGRLLASAAPDLTILLWQLPAATKVAGPVTAAKLDQCWNDLSAADAGLAFTAMLLLAGHPDKSLPFLERKLGAEVNGERVAQLLADLDNPTFRVREQASKELAEMGNRVRSAVEGLRKKSASAEVLKRCDALLKQLRPRDLRPGELQIERGIEALRMIGGAQAEKVLRGLGTK